MESNFARSFFIKVGLRWNDAPIRYRQIVSSSIGVYPAECNSNADPFNFTRRFHT